MEHCDEYNGIRVEVSGGNYVVSIFGNPFTKPFQIQKIKVWMTVD